MSKRVHVIRCSGGCQTNHKKSRWIPKSKIGTGNTLLEMSFAINLSQLSVGLHFSLLQVYQHQIRDQCQ